MEEITFQFSPARLRGVSYRNNVGYGRKFYTALFIQGGQTVHGSVKPFKTATDAQVYARKVVERYQRLARVAMAQFVESQHVAG